MKSGWIVGLAVASAFAIAHARAAEPEKLIRCEIRVLRVSDDCFEKMCRCATAQPKPTCCDQSACCPKSSCCEKQTCGDNSSCCEKSNCCEKPACCPKSCCGTNQRSCQSLPAVMPSCKAKAVMDMIQSDPRCEVMCCPQLITLNGQTGAVRVGATKKFVTAVTQVRFQARNVSIPTETDVESGMQLRVLPIIAPDERTVFLGVNCELTELERDPAPLFPVTTTVTPVFEGGSQGQPIPFTQFIQLPSFTTRGAHRFAVCGENQTMVLDCGRSTRVRETDTSVPFLSDIPVVGELFQSKCSEVVTDRVVVFVTPTDCNGEAGEECTVPTAKACEELPLFAQPAMCEPETLPVAPRLACTPPCVAPCPTAAGPAVAALTQATAVAPCGLWMMATPVTPPVPSCHGEFGHCGFGGPVACDPAPTRIATQVRLVRATAAVAPCSANDLPLVNLMIEYHEACAAGDRAKARNLAAKCIALDPMCFSR